MNPQEDITWTATTLGDNPVLVIQVETLAESQVFRDLEFKRLMLRRLTHKNGLDTFALVDLNLEGILLEAPVGQDPSLHLLLERASTNGLWLLFLQYLDTEGRQVTKPWCVEFGHTGPLLDDGGTINHWKVRVTEEPIR